MTPANCLSSEYKKLPEYRHYCAGKNGTIQIAILVLNLSRSLKITVGMRLVPRIAQRCWFKVHTNGEKIIAISTKFGVDVDSASLNAVCSRRTTARVCNQE
jgi:hypothetical protein